MKLYRSILALVVTYLVTTASLCNPNLSPVGNIANVASKIESTADQMVKSASGLHAAVPTVMTDSRLAAIAIAGDKVGRFGQDLDVALNAYNTAKAAGSDPSQQAVAVQAALSSITQALSDLGKQIPSGTVASVDQAIVTILGLVTQVKAGLSL